MGRDGRSRSSLRLATDMTARNWRRSWTVFVCRAPVGAGGRERAPIASSPTKATAIHTVVGFSATCRSRIPFLSAEINGRVARSDLVRALVFEKAIYARRNVEERCINRLKQWRGLATRYEKRAANYRAMVVIASIIIWLDS